MRIAPEHNGRRRVWSETVPLAQLCDPAVLRLLADRGVELLAAVRPGLEDDAAHMVEAARGRGVRVMVWPMLRDEDGRWVNEENRALWTPWVQELLRVTQPDGLAVDVEPSIERVRKLLRGRVTAAKFGPRHPAPALAHPGVETIAALVPVVLADPVMGRGWQRALGIPIPRADAYSPMLYSSLATGYSRGMLRREDVRGLVHAAARRCRRIFGARASVSVGATGIGALGDERLLESPMELADDVAIVRAAGIDDIALFDLGGLLRRPEPERWLDALCNTPPAVAPPPLTPRARAALGLTRMVSLLVR